MYTQIHTHTHRLTLLLFLWPMQVSFCTFEYIVFRITFWESTLQNKPSPDKMCFNDAGTFNQWISFYFLFYLSFCFIHKTLSAQSKLVSFPTSHSTSTCRHCNIYINAYIFFQVSLMVNMVYNINNFLYLILITSKAGLIPGSTCITHQGAFFHT